MAGKISAEYRCARPDDVADIFALLQEMHAEVGMLSISDIKVIQRIASVLKNGICFMAFVEDKPVGAIGVEPGDMWYSEDVFLSERWTFVKAGYRRSTIGKDLLKMADDFAKRAGVSLVAGVFSPNQVQRKNALFRRLFTPVGEIFVGGNKDVLRR